MHTRELGADDASASIEVLSEILVDCVEGGASVNFMLPFSMDEARAFWRGVVAAVEAGRNRLFVAHDESGALSGTVQLFLATPPNQPHRAEVTKLLVHRRARRQGMADALMATVEKSARDAGRSLLILDTMTGSDAERLYVRRGWMLTGIIPGYALFPDGRLGDTSHFWLRVA